MRGFPLFPPLLYKSGGKEGIFMRKCTDIFAPPSPRRWAEDFRTDERITVKAKDLEEKGSG